MAHCTPRRATYNCRVSGKCCARRAPRASSRRLRGRFPCDDMPDVDSLNLVIVDDDEDVRAALRRLLRSMGHEVHLFASAEEYEAGPAAADCLIVDLRLPGLNGFELRDRL